MRLLGREIDGLQEPRVINQTPPNGEAFIDSTTDWEDPDNQFTVLLPARRTFTVRLRFAQPLDPRSVSPATFTMTKTAQIDAAGVETAVSALLDQLDADRGTAARRFSVLPAGAGAAGSLLRRSSATTSPPHF